MTDPFEHDEVPAELAAAFPEVGDAGAPTSEPPEVPPNGLDGLHALLDAEGPTDAARSLSSGTRRLLGAGFVVALGLLVVFATPRVDLDVYPASRMALDLSLMLGPFVFALIASLRPLSKPALSARWRGLTVAAGVLSIIVLLVLPVAHHDHPASAAGEGAMFWRQAATCFGFGLGSAIVATIGLSLLSRTSSRAGLPGALGMWAAGLAGLYALYLHCPITDLEHLWAGHGTIVLPVLAIVWALRKRLDG